MAYTQYVQPFGEAHSTQSQMRSSPLHNLASVTIYESGNRLCFITRHTSEGVNFHHIFHNENGQNQVSGSEAGLLTSLSLLVGAILKLIPGGFSDDRPYLPYRCP